MMGNYAFFAEALRYPAPGRLPSLLLHLSELAPGATQQVCRAFLSSIEKMSLSDWEELYTRTLDLNPTTIPYIGFQIWGESYRRGEFLAQMNKTLQSQAIDLDGELPDHLVPVLRYLEAAREPLPQLMEVIESAVQRMIDVLHKHEPQNPYCQLLEGVQMQLQTNHVIATG
jgi:nitrate reductase molybdenum cofactor assembly chaperone NarJ/NarW